MVLLLLRFGADPTMTPGGTFIQLPDCLVFKTAEPLKVADRPESCGQVALTAPSCLRKAELNLRRGFLHVLVQERPLGSSSLSLCASVISFKVVPPVRH